MKERCEILVSVYKKGNVWRILAAKERSEIRNKKNKKYKKNKKKGEMSCGDACVC